MQQPFKTYPGGKSGNGTYQAIINNIPDCDLFIDAMAGNGGISVNLKNALCSIVINDIDAGIIDAFKKKYTSRDLKDKTGYNCSIELSNAHYLSLIEKYDFKGHENGYRLPESLFLFRSTLFKANP